MLPQDRRERPRPPLRRALLALVVGAAAVMAASQSSPAIDRAALDVAPSSVAATQGAKATHGAMDSPRHASTDRLSSIVEPGPAASRLGRPALDVAQPAAQAVVRPIAGSTVVFLGDSYTSGWNGAGVGSRGWPRLVAAARDWRTVNLAVPGTGFINRGWTNQPVGSRVSAAIRRGPDIVVVAAGHNDSRWSAAATSKAADKVIHRLRAALPEAVLVIVAPIWPGANAPQRCRDLRDHLRRTAAEADAIFIDPLADGWFSGSRQRLIGADGIHPTNAGHRFMAQRVLAALAGTG